MKIICCKASDEASQAHKARHSKDLHHHGNCWCLSVNEDLELYREERLPQQANLKSGRSKGWRPRSRKRCPQSCGGSIQEAPWRLPWRERVHSFLFILLVQKSTAKRHHCQPS